MLALAWVAALLGLCQLFFGLIFFLPVSIRSGQAFIIGFGVLTILFGLYFCYIGFLGWFRFSPLAVRHIVGILALCLFGSISEAVRHFESAAAPGRSALYPLCSLAGALLVYLLYRWVVSYCCRYLFPLKPPPLPGSAPLT